MKEIGGYFELELHKGAHGYHDTPYKMKSGRSAFHYICSIVKPELVHVPYYICNAAIEPLEQAGIRYKFYEINAQLEPKHDFELKEKEYLLYVNYLDLKRNAVAGLSEKYKDKLIVDCAQAFFMKGNGVSWFFNSCRKFFGVPDGSYLYVPEGIDVPIVEQRNEGYIVDHLIRRFNGSSNDGYKSFLQNEDLAGGEIYAMSKLSEYLLSGVDYEAAAAQRRLNYKFFHDRFKSVNLFNADLDSDSLPIFYPLLLSENIDKSILYDKHIFISELWKEALRQKGVDGFEFEKDLIRKLWPLPIDHRYTSADMEVLYKSLMNIIP